MASRKVFVVFGATGTQGGSVINSVLADPKASQEFKIRGVTRNPESEKAKSLTARGVECVEANFDSKESLRKAFKGAFAVFAVTNYWEKQDPELELQQGKNICDAAMEDGVQHLIWSSLLNVTELTNGKFSHVDHFDSKANVEKYIRSQGVPASFFMPGFYMQNLAGGFMRPNAESKEHEYIFAMPVPAYTPIPLFDAANDAGKFVKAILMHREETLGKNICAATDYYTCEQIIREFLEVKQDDGVIARFVQVSPETFKKTIMEVMHLDDRGATEMLQNQQFMTDYGYYGKADLKESQKLLDEKPTTWREFVKKAPQFRSLT